MDDLGKQICRCIAGACDETCRHYYAEKSCCVGYEEVVQQVEKVFSEYESYKDLEEQNRLLKLPCAVGDTVYTACSWGIESGVVGSIEIISDRIFVNNTRGQMIGEAKNIFLTKEEAEAALEELERGKGK